MAHVELGGQDYKVRTRNVNGQKTQVYYKDGEAYIKNGDGKLEKLNKFDDGVFKKASYITDDAKEKINQNYAESLNTKYSDENRPTINGQVDYNSFTYGSEIVGYKGKFRTTDGSSVSGVVYRDAETKTNKVLAEENHPNGNSVKQFYVLQEDSGEFFLESSVAHNADGSTFTRKYNYDTQKYEYSRTAPEQQTQDTTDNTIDAIPEIMVYAKAPKAKGLSSSVMASLDTAPTDIKIKPIDISYEQPAAELAENKPKPVSTNAADYPRGAALKDAVNITGLGAEQLASLEDGTPVKVLYNDNNGKRRVIGGLINGGNFTYPVQKNGDGTCYVGVYDATKLVGEDGKLNIKDSRIATVNPEEDLMANS